MASVPFNNLITFSRGSNATLTGSNGLIQWAPSNLLTFSEQFDNAAWTKVLSASATANTDTAPDGTTTADTVVAGASNSAVRQTVTTQADSYTFSCWVKRKTGTGDVQISASGGSWVTQSLTTSWQRFSVTQSLSAGSNFPGVRITTSGDEVYVWGAQLELGSAATTYNSTTVKNLLGFSEAFDNAAWTKSNASIVTGAQANPVNGAFNAQKLMENTATSTQHYIRLNSVAVPIAPLVFSVYVKASGRTNVRLVNASYGNAAYFTLTGAGSVGTTDGATGSITAIGDGWYRCAVAFTQTVATTVGFDIRLANASTGGSDIYTGDGNSGVYIYGAQLSDSASLDPYVPTPAAAPSSTAYYGPRFDYDPVTLQPKGLLVEEARTNLVRYSEDFTNAAWVDISAGTTTRTANFGVAPDGTMTADRIQGNNVNTWLAQDGGSRPSQTLTFSVWLRANSGTPSGVALVLSVSAGGTYSTSITVTSTWTRFTFTITTAAGDTNGARVGLNQGNGNDLLIWGAQLEAGAFATSYIPTVASTVTRSADVATINGSLFSQWYGQSAGTFVANYQLAAPTISQDLFMANAGAPLTASLGIYIGSGTSSLGWVRTGGVTQCSIPASISSSANNKTAFGYATNDFSIAANGTLGTPDTSGTLPTVDRLTFGANNIGGAGQAVWLRSIDYIPARAADFQLQALTL